MSEARYCFSSERRIPPSIASAISPAAARGSMPPGIDAIAPTPPHASSITTGEVIMSVLALPHVVTACVITSHASSIRAIQPASA